MTAFDLSAGAARRALAPTGADDDRDDARERYATAVWCQLIEPGDSVAGRLIAARGAAPALEAVLAEGTLPDVTPRELAEGRKRWLPRLSARAVADSLTTAAARGVTLVTRSDPQWPNQLDDLDAHAPVCLWVRGDVAALRRLEASVAIVGARAASRYGDHVAMELSAELAGRGIGVVSGGAYGIDGAAHRAALSAGGLTVALLAGGADRSYPAGHTQLIDDIAERGVVASEVACGSAPTKWRFLQRNRLIAALSAATVVVEAGWRSGSLNTAGHAAALSRPLGAVPGPITSATSAGTHRLIREYGAQCITGADDVRELLGMGSGMDDHAGVQTGYTGESTRVMDALSTRAWRESADIARRAGMAADAVEGLLGLLRLDGSVEAGADGWRLTRRVGG
ncbi:DNA protecting protein DprA [Microbacterium sp. B35-04]|uniref:DNA-processing protein DprA n=1 Tax=unclassified Microbacterium TaxID=2609290 RepID=UPI0013D400C4|nr:MULTISPECIES: DNA-processing protein DprA [unclassified Microbacterium]KAF2412138.1 DNA protecting protein DprA [Microbacterium sp. B35-04]KAF2419341.1 DNA protecting protein DprA [Microbacterium sp. B35-30]